MISEDQIAAISFFNILLKKWEDWYLGNCAKHLCFLDKHL